MHDIGERPRVQRFDEPRLNLGLTAWRLSNVSTPGKVRPRAGEPSAQNRDAGRYWCAAYLPLAGRVAFSLAIGGLGVYWQAGRGALDVSRLLGRARSKSR